jgi:tetratricopeptide (TPR) repeat protein
VNAAAIFLVGGLALVAPQEKTVTHRGQGFTLAYPEKNSKVQPPSASVPFALEYRKNNLVRLEIERLTQPIDLEDPEFAAIFMEVQLEHLKERVSEPLQSKTVRRFPWGTGVEFVYSVPSRNGKKNERDRVTEVVTTVEETLYRFTSWIPEKEVAKVGPTLAEVVASFSPSRAAPATAPAADRVTASPGFSLAGLDARIREHRDQIDAAAPESAALADAQAGLAESLGLKAYLTQGASSSELEEISRAADTAVRLAPDEVDTQRARAWAAYHREQMVEMEKAIRQALSLDAKDAQTHFLYALWYGFNPRESGAMARAALEAYPAFAPAHYVKALADRRASDLAEARKSLEQAVKLDPTFTRARLELAEVLEQSEDFKAAAGAYRELSRSSPADESLHFRLAVVARKAGLIDEAITEYQTALKLDPSLAEAHYNLAVLYVREKQAPDLAAESFKRFLELDPESDRAEAVRRWLRDNRY